MHKLDPHRAAAGRLALPPGAGTAPQRARSYKTLLQLLDGDCLLLDGVCPQHISRSLLCRWFRRAVFAATAKAGTGHSQPKKLRRCEVCGTGILARSGRTKYCPACAKDIHRQQKAKSARKRRSGVDNLGAKSPLNCKHSRTTKAARQYDFPRSREIEFYLST